MACDKASRVQPISFSSRLLFRVRLAFGGLAAFASLGGLFRLDRLGDLLKFAEVMQLRIPILDVLLLFSQRFIESFANLFRDLYELHLGIADDLGTLEELSRDDVAIHRLHLALFDLG